jgi:hypothetical protein
MTCNCITEVNAAIADKNGELAVGLAITKDLGLIAKLLIGVEKKDKSKRVKPPIVSATFCPFCGVKFDGCALAGKPGVSNG